MSNQLSDSLREHEYRSSILEALNSIANSLKSIAHNQTEQIETSKKVLAVTMIGVKTNLAIALKIGSIDDALYQEAIDILNQV